MKLEVKPSISPSCWRHLGGVEQSVGMTMDESRCERLRLASGGQNGRCEGGASERGRVANTVKAVLAVEDFRL